MHFGRCGFTSIVALLCGSATAAVPSAPPWQPIDAASDPEAPAEATLLHDRAVDLLSECSVELDVHWQAAEMFGRARDLRIARGERLLAAESSADLATLYSWMNRWGEMEEAERWALQIRREELQPEDPLLGESLLGLSYALFEQGRFGEIEPLLLEAQEIYLLADDEVGLAEVLNSLGELRRMEDRFDDAAWLFESALRRTADDDELFRARILNNRALLHMDRGEHRLAELRLRESLELRQGSPDSCPRDLATAHLSLAEILRVQDEYEHAAPHFAEALRLARRSIDGRNPELAWFLVQNGVFEEGRGNLPRAEALFDEALEITRAGLPADHLLVAFGLHDLAQVKSKQGEPEGAERLLREALSIRERVLGAEHPEVADTLLRLAEVALRQGRRDEQLSLLHRARGIADTSDSYPEVRAAIYQALAVATAGEADLGGALDLELIALDVLEPLRAFRSGGESERLRFLAEIQEGFQRALRLAIALGRPAEAFALAERSRARVFLDSMAIARGGGLWESLPEEHREALLVRKQRIATSLAAVEKSLGTRQFPVAQREDELRRLLAEKQRWQRELDAIEREARSASPSWALVASETVRLRQAQGLVDGAGWLLIYQLGNEEGFLLAVPKSPQPMRMFSLEIAGAEAQFLGVAEGPLSRSRLQAALGGISAELATVPGGDRRPGPQLVRRLAALFRTLVPAEIRAAVVDSEQVVVLPDGALSALPFESLVLSAGDEVVWWLDAGPLVRYAPSATVLASLDERRRSKLPGTGGARIVSVSMVDLPEQLPLHRLPCRVEDAAGSPPVKGWRPAPLPGSGFETDRLIALFGRADAGGEVLALQGGHATEGAVRAGLPLARWLHFATHGIIGSDARRPCAALALAPAGGSALDDDGFLEADEIQSLKLQAEIAVLSACSTHGGSAVAGESLAALSRAFLLAGASRVLASAWQVDDAATAEVIGGLFESLRRDVDEGRAPRYAEAARGAKRAVRAKPAWSHPYYWAPLVLSGVE